MKVTGLGGGVKEKVCVIIAKVQSIVNGTKIVPGEWWVWFWGQKWKKENKTLNYYKDFSQTDLSWYSEDEKTHQSLWCLLSGTHWMCHTKAGDKWCIPLDPSHQVHFPVCVTHTQTLICSRIQTWRKSVSSPIYIYTWLQPYSTMSLSVISFYSFMCCCFFFLIHHYRVFLIVFVLLLLLNHSASPKTNPGHDVNHCVMGLLSHWRQNWNRNHLLMWSVKSVK